MTDLTASTLPAQQTASRSFRRKRMASLAAPVLILVYLTYVFFAFDVAGLGDRINVSNMKTLVADSYSYKTHVARDNRNGEMEIAIEGERKGRYAPGTAPDWVTLGETTRVELGNGHTVGLGPEVRYDVPGYGLITATPGSSGVNASLPDGPLPEWINASKNRLAITTDAGRLTVYS